MRKITKAEEKWLQTEAMPNYLIYSKKKETAYCTHCNTEIETKQLKKIRIGNTITCPHCHKKIKIKNEKLTNEKIEYGTGIIPTKENNNLILRYFYITKFYENGWRKNKTTYKELLREEYELKKDGEFIVTDRKFDEERWLPCEIRSGHYMESWYTHRPIGTHANLPRNIAAVYTRNISKYTKNTIIEKLPLQKILKTVKLPNRYSLYGLITDSLHGYANFYEYLYKVGFHKLFEEMLRTNPHIKIKPEKKSLIDMLSLTKETYRELLEIKKTAKMEDLDRFQRYVKFNITKQKDREIFDKFIVEDKYFYDWKAENFFKLLPITLQKFGKWAETQKNFELWEYTDYLRMCKTLELDMKNSFVSTPRDLKQAHDMVTDMYNEMQFDIKLKKYADEGNQYKKEYKKTIEQNKLKYKYEDKQMKVVVPKNTKEIGIEGYKLRHCVASYIKDVIENKKTILFIRNKNQITVPYYTMEIVGKRITQCKGYRNCPRTEEVNKFLKSFAKSKKLTIAKTEKYQPIM